MPINYEDTRRFKARELLSRLESGPSFSHWNFAERQDPEKTALEDYKIWTQSWVIPVLKELLKKDLAPRNKKEVNA